MSVLFQDIIPQMEQEIKLDAETELRFSVPEGSTFTVVLMNGLAEMFGSELLSRNEYTFRSHTNGAIFTWKGCNLFIRGNSSFHIAKATPMVIFANVHAAIEQMRQIAEESHSKGPTVIITGPMGVGKSTLCRILTNYAVRQGRKPIYVDLDVGQGNVSIPGAVGSLLVENTAGIEEGFSQKSPLVYHYGYKSPGNNLALYNCIVSAMSKFIRPRVEKRADGIIINTCGWVKDDGYRALTHAIISLEVDIVIVLGLEKFFMQISRHLPKFVKTVYLPKFNGTVECDYSYRSVAREKRIHEYFYGFKSTLHPHRIDVNFSAIKFYRIEKSKQPVVVGETPMRLVPYHIGSNLKNRIISISFAKSTDENVAQTHIAGFLCVLWVDMGRQKLALLSPEPPPLPEGIFLCTDIDYIGHQSGTNF